jgi:DNA-binding GntR family transcriptional regulator
MQVVAEHSGIVDALERRDGAAALGALVEHLYRSDYAIADEATAHQPTREKATR